MEIPSIAEYLSSPPAPKKLAAVYAVSSPAAAVQYIGVTRDLRGSLSKHLAVSPSLATSASAHVFPRPSRAAMSALQASLLSRCPSPPPGNADPSGEWARPPLSDAEAEQKLKLRQASADGTLADEDPEAWSAVVRKSMKGGDGFDGSEADLLDASIGKDAESTARGAALRRAAGDWGAAVEEQTLRAAGQFADLEMYVGAGCPHCERMRGALSAKNLVWQEFDVKGEYPGASEDQTRRLRHASWNTVPQLYVVRRPPYNGRDSETLVGGADDMLEKMRTPLWDYWIGE
ncbi:hypothetical protein TeGR_g613 [Tetraparma gracilis]|uniref:Glutaredoxin domain-containing protein n=1 Tax=Tetraparma gracilis TaxID=2962635 RepID=A0ABQ6MKP3_9STRA|nr:hypothetical protein TeGR_g613 [Tetraparma gracilis]